MFSSVSKKMKRRIGRDQVVRTRRKNSPYNLKLVEERNWVDLPCNVMILIFSKLGAIDILYSAQFVCSSWLELAKDPRCFRSLHLPHSTRFQVIEEAIDRSRGGVVEISLGVACCTDNILHYVVKKATANSLKTLKLASCTQITDQGLVEACRNVVGLEEFELNEAASNSISIGVFEIIGHSCPDLKCFRLRHRIKGSQTPLPIISRSYFDKLSVIIAHNMPNLHGLCLCLSTTTLNGLQAIIDRCRHLKSLDFQGSSLDGVRSDLHRIPGYNYRDWRVKSEDSTAKSKAQFLPLITHVGTRRPLHSIDNGPKFKFL